MDTPHTSDAKTAAIELSINFNGKNLSFFISRLCTPEWLKASGLDHDAAKLSPDSLPQDVGAFMLKFLTLSQEFLGPK